MNRRNFFKGLLTVAAAAIAAPFLPAQKAIVNTEVDWIHTFPATSTPTSTLRKIKQSLSGPDVMPFSGRHYDVVIFDDLIARSHPTDQEDLLAWVDEFAEVYP